MWADQFRLGSGLLGACVLLLLPACVSTPKLPPPRVAAATTLPLEPAIDRILPDGEETSYKVSKGILTVGEVVYRVAHVKDAGTELLRLESHTQASAWLAAFVQIGGTTHSYVDRATLLPSSYYWVTASKEDPLIRTATFDHATGRVFASAYQQKCLETRVIHGQEIHDPVSAIMLARVLDFSRVPEEIRFYVVEGIDLHLMTLRLQDREMLDVDEPCPVATRRVSLRTDRLDCEGKMRGEEPYNSLLLWIAEAPPHTVYKIEGTIGGTALKLALKKRTVGGGGAATRPAS